MYNTGGVVVVVRSGALVVGGGWGASASSSLIHPANLLKLSPVLLVLPWSLLLRGGLLLPLNGKELGERERRHRRVVVPTDIVVQLLVLLYVGGRDGGHEGRGRGVLL